MTTKVHRGQSDCHHIDPTHAVLLTSVHS